MSAEGGNDAALVLKGVVKRYRKRFALNGLDLSVPRGSVFGLVGSNGAGKTTTLSVAAGLVRPQAGSVDLLGEGPFDPVRHAGRVSLLPQDAAPPPTARPHELLSFYARLQGMRAPEAEEEAARALSTVHLGDRRDSAVRTLSHGMKKRLIIAQAFLGSPELVMLDEPLTGLDPREVLNVRGMITRQNRGQTIIVSSHNLHEIQRICDCVAFVEDGRTVYQDRMEQATGNRQVLNYHLDSGSVPLEELRGLLPGVMMEIKEHSRRLTCRYLPRQHRPTEINRIVLSCLFDADIGVFAVYQGDELETTYMRHATGAK